MFELHTSHSLCPWQLSCFSFLMATPIPVPGLVGANVFSSIHPLKTQPNSPSPRKYSRWKFLEDCLRSFNAKDFKLNAASASTVNDGEPTTAAADAILFEFVELI